MLSWSLNTRLTEDEELEQRRTCRTEGESGLMMNTTLTLLFLLSTCWCVSASFSVVFSSGTLLQVDDAGRHGEDSSTGLPPSLQIFWSLPLAQDPGSPHLLLCLLDGLTSPLQDVLWWVDDEPVTSSNAQVSWARSQEGGAYSAISVWEVSAADWRTRSSYWCGTIQKGQVYRRRLCSED